MKKFNHQSGQYLEVGTARIYYEIAGTEGKPVLLILHGGFGSLEDTTSIHDALYPLFTVIGIDTRGHGKSTLGSEELTYERVQQDVELVLQHLKIDRVSILGFSDGGIVAYRLAAFSNLRIEKMVTIGSTWHNKNLAATRPIFEKLTAKSWTEKFPDTVALYNKLNPDADFDRLTDVVKKMWLDTDLSGHANEAVSKFAAPLLIIRGDKDHLSQLKDVAELAGIVKNSSIFVVPFAEHDTFNQQPDLIIEILKQFFK